MGLGKYIKKAFLFHWNLLAFLGGMGFAVISGHPDVVAPLVLAAEAAYLGFHRNASPISEIRRRPGAQDGPCAGRCRGRRATARSASARPASPLPGAARPLPLGAPDRRTVARARRRRCRCARSMSSSSPISTACSGSTCARSTPSTCSSDSFESTSGDQIQTEIRRLEDRIRRLEKEPDSANRARIRQSLQANLETGRSRLSNLEKARENYELLQAEIENLETKIQSITELAINRSDADAITGQVEQITQGLVRTEQTINDLGFATGGESFDLTVPTILSARGRRHAARLEARGAAAAPAARTRSSSFDSRPRPRSSHGSRTRGLILGINCAYHESAAALVRDGEVVFAIEEERFTRIKHAKTARVSNPDELPWNAIRACLESVPDAQLSDLDAIAYSLAPGRRLALIGVDPYELG